MRLCLRLVLVWKKDDKEDTPKNAPGAVRGFLCSVYGA